MKRLESYAESLPKDTQALAVVILASIVFVVVGRWLVGKFVGRLRKPSPETDGVVVAFRRPNPKKSVTRRRRSLRIQNLSPLWFVAIAIGLSIFFKLQPDFAGSKENLVGRVTHVRDGDTIEVAGRAIRLNPHYPDDHVI